MLIGTFLLLAATLFGQESDDEISLRIVWGGGTARQWSGSILIEDGTLIGFETLGIEPDENASLLLASNQELRIQQRRPQAFDGVDLRCKTSDDTLITVILSSPETAQVETAEFRISDFVRLGEVKRWRLDSEENSLIVRRSPGDRLRVRLDRDSLVFSPGESFPLVVEPSRTGLTVPAKYRCEVELRLVGADRVLWNTAETLQVGAGRQADQDGLGSDATDLGSRAVFASALSTTVELPDEEGVYQLTISLTDRKRLLAPLAIRERIIRPIQLVVVANESPADEDPATEPVEWEEHFTVGSTDSNFLDQFRKLPQINLLPRQRPAPVEYGDVEEIEKFDEKFVQLGPDSWAAYPISVKQVGQPHVLEIDYPGDQQQALGISIVEADAAGKVEPIGFDTGLEVNDLSFFRRAEIRQHRIHFWPKTDTAYVLLTNRHRKKPASFGAIRVQAGPDRLPAQPDIGYLKSPRTVAAYLAKPLFPDNFAAAESYDEVSGRTIDDWTTFLDGGRRMIEYLRHAGYNSAVLSVASEGGAIYPSRLLKPSARFDSGRLAATGQDPFQKDVLELLFRLFDRAGMRLTPAIQFASPLPELEKLVHFGNYSQGILLLGADGRSWRDTFPDRGGLVPHYNPLDLAVQQSMRGVVAELVNRYGHHPSFAGVALQLGENTYTQFPGPMWGLDAKTLLRFQQSGRVQFPPTVRAHLDAQVKFVTTEAMPVWQQWKSDELTSFFGSLRSIVSLRRPDAGLLLLTDDLFTSGPLLRQTRPSLARSASLDDALLALGIDSRKISADPQTIFPRPHRVSPAASLGNRASDMELNNSPIVHDLFGRIGAASSLFFHESQTTALPSFDELSPFGPDNTRMVLMPRFVPAGGSARQRFARRLAINDDLIMIDGGDLLPIGGVSDAAPLLEAFRKLPPLRFQTLQNQTPAGSDEVVVRSAIAGGRAFVYLVNPAPWPVVVRMQLHGPPDFRVRLLANDQEGRLMQQGGATFWDVALEPFSLESAMFSVPNVQVVSWSMSYNREAHDMTLSRQLNELRARINVLRNLIVGPTNSSFEQGVKGWVHAPNDDISLNNTVKVDMTGGQDGRQSLRIDSRGPNVWLRSEPIASPEHGQLILDLWLRTSGVQQQPRVHLAVEYQSNGKDQYRWAAVGATPDPNARLSSEWKRFNVRFDDLPLEDNSAVRVGVDLMGSGTVWVDNVRCYWFKPDEIDRLEKYVAAANAQRREGHLAACQQFLDSYWPHFIRQNVPLELAPRRLTAAPAATTSDDPEQQDEAPRTGFLRGWFDRFRR